MARAAFQLKRSGMEADGGAGRMSRFTPVRRSHRLRPDVAASTLAKLATRRVLSEAAVGGSGSVRGTVFSSTGGKVSGVTVQVLGGSSSLTNNGGKYTIQDVPAGPQTVIASKAGYADVEQAVDVTAGTSVTLDLTLTPQ